MIDVNWLSPAKRRQLVVVGEEGMFELDYLTQRLTFTKADPGDPKLVGGYAPVFEGEVIDIPVPASEPLAAELDAFLRVIRDGGSPDVGVEDGFWAVALADALLAASRTGRAVELHELTASLRIA
jgi:predicted dehydrogenase